MAQLNVSLPANLLNYVDTQASTEGYFDPSDVSQDLLHGRRYHYEADVGHAEALIEDEIAFGFVKGEPEVPLWAVTREIADDRG